MSGPWEKYGGGQPKPWEKYAAPRKRGPALPVIGDAVDGGVEAWDRLKGGVDRDIEGIRGGKSPGMLDFARLVGDTVGLVATPVTAAITRPIARAGAGIPRYATPTLSDATAVFRGERAPNLRRLSREEAERQIEQDLNIALMGIGASPGRIAAPGIAAGVRAPPPGISVAEAGAIPKATNIQAPLTAKLPPPQPPIPKPTLRVGAAVERAIERDALKPNGLRLTPGAPSFQAGGDNLAGLAEVVAQSPGKGQTVIRNAVRDQQAGASERVKSQVGQAFGGKGDYFATLDTAMEQRKATALPLKEKAFSAAIDPEVYQATFAPIMERVPSRALSFAAEIAKRDGVAASDLGLEVVGANEAGLPIVRQVKTPTMQTLHYIKKGMDQELEAYRNALGKLDLEGQPMAAATSGVRSALGRAMRDTNKDYDAFMQTWGDESGQIESLRLGRDVFSNTPEMSAERLRKHFAEMSQAEKDLYRKGVGEALIDQVRRKGGVTEARQLLKNEEFADRIRVAVPDDMSFTQFMDAMEREVEIANLNNRVVGGSPTYGRQAARADLEAQGLDPMEGLANSVEYGLNPTRIPAAALKQMLKALPRKDRSIIGDPAMNEALGLALSNPDEMTKLLNLMEKARAQRFTVPRVGEMTSRLPPPLPTPSRRGP